MLSTKTFAWNRDPANSAEWSAYNWCQSDGYGNGNHYGAIWLTNDTVNYYTDSVTVYGGDDNAQVWLRGSVYDCGVGLWGVDYYAANIYPTGDNAYRLYIQGDGNLYRGSDDGGNWTSIGGNLPAILNVSGVGNGGQLLVQINRCFSLSWGSIDGACATQDIYVTVYRPYNYSLSPNLTLNNSIVEPGGSVNVNSIIDKNGTTNSKNTYWQTTRLVYDPNSSGPNNTGGGSSGASPCDFWSGAKSCDNVRSGWNVFTASSNGVANFDETLNYPTGTKICYGLSAQPASYNNDAWIHSALKCVTVGKFPKTHVVGGDLLTRGNVRASVSTVGGLTYGSWVEYGIAANNEVVGASSGMGLVDGQVVSSACDYSKLTFNNDNSDDNSKNAACSKMSSLGHYSNISEAMPDIISNFTGTSTPISGNSTINPGTDKLSGLYSIDGDLTLGNGSSTLSPGTSVILKATGTVTIDADQLYADTSYTSINQIPQLVIIAKNIVINDDVTNIDGWLIATVAKEKTGSIETCSDYSNKTWTINSCNKQLKVNGPVVTDNLHLYRTSGSDTDSRSEAAETFNFRSDAYLWAYNYALKHSGIKTVYSTELPPRL